MQLLSTMDKRDGCWVKLSIIKEKIIGVCEECVPLNKKNLIAIILQNMWPNNKVLGLSFIQQMHVQQEENYFILH
jgi:hypothetical protein